VANDLNQCNFIGRLGKDPEVLHMPSGDAVTNMSIAVGKSWKNKSGEKQEQTTWVPIVVFGKLAEIAGLYLRKGSRIHVTGEFRVRKWQDQQGSDRYATEIVAEDILMLDGKPQEGAAPRPAAQPRSAPPAQQSAPDFDGFDDDIPF
jgi:single-strand DNA-binding protein